MKQNAAGHLTGGIRIFTKGGKDRSEGRERSAAGCQIRKIFPRIGACTPLPSALRAATFPKGEGLRLRR
jgi:hypothetical protein